MLLTPSQSAFIPLVLDLDGTVIRTDTFHEMMVCLLIQKPWILWRVPFWLLKGRAYAKAQLVERTNVNLETLPYNKSLLFFAQKEAREGRPLILATGTDQRLAQKVSDHLGVFQEVIGSHGNINMTGAQKRKALLDRFGVQGFDYAGDSAIDAAVWQISRKILVVCPKWGVLKTAQTLKDSEHIYYVPREQKRVFSFFLALRPLFWVFNLMATSVNLFVGLSFLSSGLLVAGDLFMLEKERKGLSNKSSVFAHGHLHLITAFLMVFFLILFSFIFLALVPGDGFWIGLYIPLFVSLDRLTRFAPQAFRWTLLGVFQLFATLGLGFNSETLFLLQ